MNKKVSFPEKTQVEVIGNVASGKTTLAKKLPGVTNLTYIDTDLFDENPFMIPSVEDPARWVFTEELYFSFLRSKHIPKVVDALRKSPLVLDQGFHMPFYMYTKNRYRQKHMTDEEWAFIEQLHFHLLKGAPESKITVFLDIPVDILLQRMEKRGKFGAREHENLYTREYLEQLEVGLREYVQKIAGYAQKTVITYRYTDDTFITSGEIQEKFVKILSQLVSH